MHLEIIPFHDDQIEAIRGADGKPYVSVKRICENLGIAFSRQLQKLKAAHWASVIEMVTDDTRGSTRSHSVLDRKSVV